MPNDPTDNTSVVVIAEPDVNALTYTAYWSAPGDIAPSFMSREAPSVQALRELLSKYALLSKEPAGAGALIDQPWVPYAVGGALLLAALGFFAWRRR